MNISNIVSKASDKAIEQVVSEFIPKDNKNNDSSKSFEDIKALSDKYKPMIKYCNYLVEFALEEYSKSSK